jgi:DNA (cytosine-5)-methyltransferase 1
MVKKKPAYTITTRFDTPPVGRVTHPVANRALTAREAARIQSFPDDFVFYGKKSHIGKQIGNAVPPLLANELAKNLKFRLGLSDKNQVPKNFKNFQYRLKLA